MKILTDFSLWRFLFHEEVRPGTKVKFSKGEAFFDLLTRQRQSATVYETDVVTGNYQTLAGCWGWHRQTVRKFLQELAAIGAVAIDSTSNRTVIRVTNVTSEKMASAGHSGLIQGHEMPSRGNIPP